MEQELQQLEALYQKIREATKPQQRAKPLGVSDVAWTYANKPQAHEALCDYVAFIETTAPFGTMVRQMRRNPYDTGIRTLDRMRDKEFVSDVEVETFMPYVSMVHRKLVDGAKAMTPVRKKKEVLIIDEVGRTIYLKTNPKKAYTMKGRLRDSKQNDSVRFNIIHFLYKKRSQGKFSAKRLAQGIKHGDLSNLRRQVDVINEKFDAKVYHGRVLIQTGTPDKYMYELNTDFEYRKRSLK